MPNLLAGKYEMLELAGEGGMAKVYRGLTHGAAGFTRPVAIKRVIEPLTSDRNFISMFVEEARVVSELRHPNIVQIHDFDRDESGLYFLVMEWVEGINLFDWRCAYKKAGRVTPWSLVSAFAIEVLKALDAAHRRKTTDRIAAPIFHRDVTPQNVMVSVEGFVKLTDFGLARAMDRTRMTSPEIVKGKLSYLAPELTHLQEPSAQSDIYGVGIVMWEILAGEKLYKGDKPVEILRAVQDAQIPSLDNFRDDVPVRIEEAIRKALQKNPADRFNSAADMIRELASTLRKVDEPTDATTIGRSIAWAMREQSDRNEDVSATVSIDLFARKAKSDLVEQEEVANDETDDVAQSKDAPFRRKKS